MTVITIVTTTTPPSFDFNLFGPMSQMRDVDDSGVLFGFQNWTVMVTPPEFENDQNS